jgi:hypothetical protein
MQILKGDADQRKSKISPIRRTEPRDLLSVAVYVGMVDTGLEHELEHDQSLSTTGM